jgi:alkylation response protein AidB-like acyl-CoA dehydrogenase
MAQSKNGYLDKAGQVKWQKKLFERGWVAPDWPVELGGAGFTPSQRYIFNMEMSLAGTPHPSPMGLKMCAPVIMAFGTPEQKAQHLPPILSSDIWWCQGYSEPGAGSDLASLKMSAERDGDDYVLNGSKIWTTHAQWADWMFCLVRTSTEGKPQEGISFLLLPMTPGHPGQAAADPGRAGRGRAGDQPGLLRQCPRAGRQPHRRGEQGLDLRQVPAGVRARQRLCARADAHAAQGQEDRGARAGRRRRGADRGSRLPHPKIAELEIAVESLNATELRIFSGRGAGKAVGPASSMLKLAGSETQQAITELALEAVGAYAAPFVRDTWAATNDGRAGPDYAGPVAPAYFSYRKTTIYAGSSEIQKNIITKLVLGL